MAIKTFTATESVISVTIAVVSQPTTVDFMDTYGAILPANFDGQTGPDWDYSLEGDYSDGVFTVIVDSGLPTEERATIANQKTSVNCLLDRVLSGTYDCKLMQEIEAVTLLIQSSEGDIAREVYSDILSKCTKCADLEDAPLEGISIWIIDETFIVQ